ncbi:MAG TPA: hypothetical protein VL200_16690 [Lacunisphaera sp.]|jgi:peptidoglycan hydrolase CwlO-like protein|nr:hypothetical protein [Lacunisphaera sp.]
MKSYTLENSPPASSPRGTPARNALSTVLAIALVLVLAIAYITHRQSRGTITALQTAAAGTQTEIDQLRKNLTDTQNHAATLQKQLGDAQAQAQTAQKQLEDEKAIATGLQTQLNAAQENISKLKPAADRAAAAAQLADTKVKEAVVAREKAVTDRDQALGQVATLRAQLEAANNRANEFEQRLTEADQQIALLQKQPRRR